VRARQQDRQLRRIAFIDGVRLRRPRHRSRSAASRRFTVTPSTWVEPRSSSAHSATSSFPKSCWTATRIGSTCPSYVGSHRVTALMRNGRRATDPTAGRKAPTITATAVPLAARLAEVVLGDRRSPHGDAGGSLSRGRPGHSATSDTCRRPPRATSHQIGRVSLSLAASNDQREVRGRPARKPQCCPLRGVGRREAMWNWTR
jgi:hypothetical protein